MKASKTCWWCGHPAERPLCVECAHDWRAMNYVRTRLRDGHTEAPVKHRSHWKRRKVSRNLGHWHGGNETHIRSCYIPHLSEE